MMADAIGTAIYNYQLIIDAFGSIIFAQCYMTTNAISVTVCAQHQVIANAISDTMCAHHQVIANAISLTVCVQHQVIAEAIIDRARRRSVEIFQQMMEARDEVLKSSVEEGKVITEAWQQQGECLGIMRMIILLVNEVMAVLGDA